MNERQSFIPCLHIGETLSETFLLYKPQTISTPWKNRLFFCIKIPLAFFWILWRACFFLLQCFSFIVHKVQHKAFLPKPLQRVLYPESIQFDPRTGINVLASSWFWPGKQKITIPFSSLQNFQITSHFSFLRAPVFFISVEEKDSQSSFCFIFQIDSLHQRESVWDLTFHLAQIAGFFWYRLTEDTFYRLRIQFFSDLYKTHPFREKSFSKNYRPIPFERFCTARFLDTSERVILPRVDTRPKWWVYSILLAGLLPAVLSFSYWPMSRLGPQCKQSVKTIHSFCEQNPLTNNEKHFCRAAEQALFEMQERNTSFLEKQCVEINRVLPNALKKLKTSIPK